MREQKLIIYRNLENEDILQDMSWLMDNYADEYYNDCMYRLLDLSGSHGFYGNLWHCYLSNLLANSENSYSTACEVVGNIEGRDAFTGEIDAVITDGFTGNVFLKTTEGLGKLVKRTLTESLKKNILSIICALPAMPAIKRFSKTMDYKEYGGALFLGVKKPVVKAHGSSDEKLFYYTIKQAENFAKSGTVEIIKKEFEKNL